MYGGLKRLKSHYPEGNTTKQAAALLGLAGLENVQHINEKILKKDGVQGMSTFYGYYILEAMAKAKDYNGALNIIRNYWGAMLDLGATTFWEDFNIMDIKNSSRIDELIPKDKDDIHGGFGGYCYVGYRKSLCHGWASGPTPWLSQYVLGITLLNGGNAVKIDPHLGNLSYAKGTFPTKYGLIKVHHTKSTSREIISQIDVPKEIEIIP
ncbi:hypothetical protein Q4Q39_13980 [Flavivirga amylovorans]|uniref:Alpha-L-rhamnosidase n=1 Tax=Flavivirga amylovorans TaxID=870486 RepID=A0ABT8X3H6_9FLAO|nr:hypothetical protein [Flavivirga amylovorans]MDO5988517.1 hypothetical protein [Flavivirga amylovorans]